MTEQIKRTLFIILGWFFVFLGILGFILPLMPGTVFLILALFFFAQSSEKFHTMLLNNSWFGNDLKQWEKTKTISAASFKKATIIIILSFSASIILLNGRIGLQLMLMSIAFTIIWYLNSIRERSKNSP